MCNCVGGRCRKCTRARVDDSKSFYFSFCVTDMQDAFMLLDGDLVYAEGLIWIQKLLFKFVSMSNRKRYV